MIRAASEGAILEITPTALSSPGLRVWVTRVYPGFHKVRFSKNQGGLKLPCDGTRVKLLKIVTKQGKTRVELDLPWFCHRVMKMKP